MRSDDLMKCIDRIDDDIVAEYAETEKKAKYSWVKWEIAACLMLVAAIGAMLALTGLKTHAGPPDMSLVVWAPIQSGVDVVAEQIYTSGGEEDYYGKKVSSLLYEALKNAEKDNNVFLAIGLQSVKELENGVMIADPVPVDELTKLLDKYGIYYEIIDYQKIYHDAGIYGEFVDNIPSAVYMLPTSKQFKNLIIEKKDYPYWRFVLIPEKEFNRRSVFRPERTEASDWEGINIEKVRSHVPYNASTMVESFESTEQLWNLREYLLDHWAAYPECEINIRIDFAKKADKAILENIPVSYELNFVSGPCISIKIKPGDISPELVKYITDRNDVDLLLLTDFDLHFDPNC